MSVNAQTQFRKRSKLFLLIGLPIALLISLLMIAATRKRGWLWVVRQSKYAPMEKILIAQSKHETGNWTSQLFKSHHNLFGMKYDKNFPGVSYQGPLSPEGDYYAGYNEWSDSAKHLLWWLDRKGIPVTTNVADYTKSIQDKGYFTAGLVDYTEGVKRWL